MMNSEFDIKFMRRALALARRGIGQTSPNPCVGAVIVHQGRLIGEGWHQAAGLPHAEVEAIRDAVSRGKKVSGAALYVTLEPCSTWGRTPPCTEAILSAGFRRVVVGTKDPNPKHAGRGLKWLKSKGIQVTENILEEPCRELNRAWNHWIVHGTPWVVAKCAMTLDGKIATARGESQWITGEKARRLAHALRSQADAVLVGVHTVLRDDPRLNVRIPGYRGKQPLRIILDPRARTPNRAKLLQNPGTLIFTTPKAPQERVRRLRKAGAILFSMPCLNVGVILKKLGRSNISHLLVEGGGITLGSFFDSKKVNEICFFVAPMILGGGGNLPAVGGKGFLRWDRSAEIEEFKVRKIGCDLMITGQVKMQDP